MLQYSAALSRFDVCIKMTVRAFGLVAELLEVGFLVRQAGTGAKLGRHDGVHGQDLDATTAIIVGRFTTSMKL